MNAVFCCYVFVSLVALVAAQCPDGWMNHGTVCYHFSHDKENWIGAQTVCEHYEASLAEIHTQYEDNFLMQEAVRRKGVFWVGASDLMVENEWRWYQSNALLNYSNWGANEPNNRYGNENCVEIRGPEVDWNDHTCSILNWYICQKNRDDSSEIIG